VVESMVAFVRQRIARRRSRSGLLTFPVALLGFLIVYFALLPTGGLPTHPTGLAHSVVVGVENDGASQARQQADERQIGDRSTGTARAARSDEHESGIPFCHSEVNYAWVTTGRSRADEPVAPHFVALPSMLGLVFLMAPSPAAATCRRWSPRPRRQLSGADLLTFVCLSQT
jgi:hypothetical protein